MNNLRLYITFYNAWYKNLELKLNTIFHIIIITQLAVYLQIWVYFKL